MYLVLVGTLILMFALDFLWLYLKRDTYEQLVQSVQKEPMVFSFSKMAGSYLFLAFAVVAFMIPNVLRDSPNLHPIANAIRNGAVLGCVIYGIFNFTNIALFKNYSTSVAVIDTLWGTALFFLTALVLSYYIYLQP